MNSKWRNSAVSFAVLALFVSSGAAQAPQPDGAGLERGVLPEKWITGGPDCAGIPKWQVHSYNPDLYIIRESGCTNYEKPFLYLLFGKERALLQDTGAGETDVAAVIAKTIAEWCMRNGRGSIPLVVAHSHAHGDHISGDAQFTGKPGITLVPLKPHDVQEAFGIRNWPDGMGSIDLGGRVLDVLPIPGHEPSGVAFYDRRTGILLTGDTLYPGRLYVSDFSAYAASIQRLVDFTKDKPMAHILGCHIEQSSTPFLDYPVGTKYQPEEHPLALSHAHLVELNEALKTMSGKPARFALRDITIWPRLPR